MHHGKIATSKRLQNTLAILKLGPATTREIREYTDSCAVNSDIAALRENGFKIECTPQGKTPDGGRVYIYTLISFPSDQAPESLAVEPDPLLKPIKDGCPY